MAGIINIGGSEGSGRGCDSPAESCQEDDDDSMDLYSDLIIDEHDGHPPRSSQNNNQAAPSSELEKLRQEILKLKQQNDKLKNESEETSRRLQKKDSELSQLRKRTLSCGRCGSNVDLHDTGSWQGHSPFSPHSSFTSQTRAKPIVAKASCQHKKRRINPELIVKYSDSNLSNHAFSQVGKGDTFHEYLKIFPDSRGGDSQDAGDCGEATVGECDKAATAQSDAAVDGTEPPHFPVPFHISDEMPQSQEEPKIDGVSPLAPDDIASKEVEHESNMSKLIAEIANKSRLKSEKSDQKRGGDHQAKKPNSEMSTSKCENVSQDNNSGEVLKVSATTSKSTNSSSDHPEVEKKETTPIKMSPAKEISKSHSRESPAVKPKSKSPTKPPVHKQSKETVDAKQPQSVFDPVKGVWSELPCQADVAHSEKRHMSSSKDVCSKSVDETAAQKASAHTKNNHSNSSTSRSDKEKSLHSSHSKSDRGKSSHSSSSRSDKSKSSQSLISKSDKDKSARTLKSRSDREKSSESIKSKSDKDKSSTSRYSRSDKSKYSQSTNTKADKNTSSRSLQSKSDKDKTDSHKHPSSDKQYRKEGETSKSEHRDKSGQDKGSALKISLNSSSDQQHSHKGDARSSSKSKERYSKSKSKENLQDDKRIKPPSSSTDKHKDLPGKVPSTPRHQTVIEANYAFQNFTENLGLSSKSTPKDKKQADIDREKKNNDRAEGAQDETKLAQKALLDKSTSSNSTPNIESVYDKYTPTSLTPLQEIQKNENQTHSHTEERTNSKHEHRQHSSKVKTKEVSSVKHSSKDTQRKEVKPDKGSSSKGSSSKGSTTVSSRDKSKTHEVEDRVATTKDNLQEELGTKETNDTDNCVEGHHVALGGDTRQEVCAESKQDNLIPKINLADAEEQQSHSSSDKTMHNIKEEVLSKKKRHHSSSSSKDKSTKSHKKTEDKTRKSDEASSAVNKSDRAESVDKPKGSSLPCPSLCSGPLTGNFKIPKKKITPEVLLPVVEPPTIEAAKSECQVPLVSDEQKSGKLVEDVAVTNEAKTTKTTQPEYARDPRIANKSYPVNLPPVQGTSGHYPPHIPPVAQMADDRKSENLLEANATEVAQQVPYGRNPRLANTSYPVDSPLVHSTGGHYPPSVPSLLDIVCIPPTMKPTSQKEPTKPQEAGLFSAPVKSLMDVDVPAPMTTDQVDVESEFSNRPNRAAHRQVPPMNIIPDILLNLVSQAKVAEAVSGKEKTKPHISDTSKSLEHRKEQKLYDKEATNVPPTDSNVTTAIKIPKCALSGKKVRTTYPVPKPTSVIQMASDDEHLLAYMCVAKRRDKQSLINRKKNERTERKRVGAKKPTLDENLEGEAVYGGCVPSSVVKTQEKPEQPPHQELSAEDMEELWNQGVDVTDPDVLAEYWRMRYASEHVQSGSSENIGVYANEEMNHPSNVQSPDQTIKQTTVATDNLSAPWNSDNEGKVVKSMIDGDRTEPQINSDKSRVVYNDNKDCLPQTETFDSETLPLKESVEVPHQSAKYPKPQASFDEETPTKVDESVIDEDCHSGKDQFQSDLELSLSLSVSTSEDSREANAGMLETQEKDAVMGSGKEESCKSSHSEDSGDSHTQMSNTAPNDLAPTKTDKQGNVVSETINRSEKGMQEQLSPRGALEDKLPATKLADEDHVPVSTIQSSAQNQNTQKPAEKNPPQEVDTKNCELKLFGKDYESERLESSDGPKQIGNNEKGNILICDESSRKAEKRKASPDPTAQTRKRMELELFGEDSMQVSMDASDIVKHNRQPVQTRFVIDQEANTEEKKLSICAGVNGEADKEKTSQDLNAENRRRQELALFGEDSIQVSMDASDIVKPNKQLLQTSLVAAQNTGPEKDIEQKQPLLPKAEDNDQDSGDDSDLDVGDSEFAVDPSAVQIEIDLSEGDSADSWTNTSQSVAEDVEHTLSVDQVLVSSADISNTPIVPLDNTQIDNSRIPVIESHDKKLTVPTSIAENKVPNGVIKCNGFEGNVDGDTSESSPIDAKQCSDVQKEDNVEKNKSIEMENETVMIEVPDDTHCTENQEPKSNSTEHSKDCTVPGKNVDNVNIKRSERDTLQVSEDSETPTKSEDLNVTDEGKDADVTEESLIDIEESSDISSEGDCAGDEMSEDQDSTLIDDSKDDDGIVNDTCSLASESGGSSLHCRSSTEDELDELDEDIPSNDSLEKTLLEDQSPELAGVNGDEADDIECDDAADDVLELHAGDSMFDEESMPPSEVNLTPRRSPRKKPTTSTPRMAKPLRTPTKDRSTPRTAKPSRISIKDRSTPPSRVRNTPSHRTPTLKKERVDIQREIEEGEAISDEEDYTPRRKDRISSSRSRTPPHHHSSSGMKRRRSISRDRDSKRVCSDSKRRDDRGSIRRHDSPSSRYVSSRDRISSHRDSRHNPKRSSSPERASTNRRSSHSESYSRSSRDSKRESPRIGVSARQSSRRIR